MGFGKIFWGLLFIMLNFRISGFDILPNIIGFILIYLGLKEIASRSEFFEKSKNFALPLIFLSIFELYQYQSTGDFFSPFVFISFLIGIAILILNLFMIYNLCMGISDLAMNENDKTLSETAIKRWKYYLSVNIISYVVLFMTAIFPPLGVLLIIPVGIAIIVVMILIVSLVKTAQNKFE